MKSICLLLICSLLYIAALAQDSALLKKIDSLSRIGYDAIDTVLYYLTAKDFLSPGNGTKIQVYKYNDTIQRIICFTHHKTGNYAIEFYRHQDSLLFVYETTEYFAEKVPKGATKNFQHIFSSEARFYYWENALAHWEASGMSPSFNAMQHAIQLRKQYREIINFIK